MKTSIYNPTSDKSGDNGYLIITISDANKGWDAKKVDIKFPVLSVWVDTLNTRAQNTCKVHALIPQSPDNVEELQAREFAIELRRFTPHNFGLSNQAFTVDEYTKILRHGVYDGNYQATDNELNISTPIFDNKSLALKNIIEFIVEQTDIKLSGVDLINLNAVSDNVLQQLGYTKIEDRLGVGIPMWAGDPLRILRPEIATASYYRNYSSRDSSKKMRDTANEFVKILEEELTKDKVAA